MASVLSILSSGKAMVTSIMFDLKLPTIQMLEIPSTTTKHAMNKTSRNAPRSGSLVDFSCYRRLGRQFSNKASWHAVHSNTETAIKVQIAVSALVLALRQSFGAFDAVRVERGWVCAEERGQRRLLAFLVLVGNVVISV